MSKAGRNPNLEYLDAKLSTRARRRLATSAEIGQEAHRQILKYKYPKWVPEQTLELIPGVIVRKDAIKLTNAGATVPIIKPNTPSGQYMATRRAQLVKEAGYKPKIELYDPKDPAFLPTSTLTADPGVGEGPERETRISIGNGRCPPLRQCADHVIRRVRDSRVRFRLPKKTAAAGFSPRGGRSSQRLPI
jgi:hypothetical protein